MVMSEIPAHIGESFKSAKNIVVLTGAGISAESGIDTFRGKDGTWNKVNVQEVATPEGFQADPVKVWDWYDYRRTRLNQVGPNPAHISLARMEEYFHDFTLVTQNVDGLHRRAGSKNIIELHGNIWDVIDTQTGERYEWREAPLKNNPPYNEKGNLIRPGVVWFGEMLPEGAFEKSILAAQKADICLVIGTSAVVQPAASIPFYAKRAGALILEFTLEPTEISSAVDHSFQGKAGETLPPFLELIGMDL